MPGTFKIGLKPLSLAFWVSGLLLLAALSYSGYRLILNQTEIEIYQKIRKEIVILQRQKQTEFDHIIERLQQTTLFMTRLPPVRHLVEVMDTQSDQPDATNQPFWTQQLQDIYQSYLTTNPNVFQARFIRYDTQGMEWVRVERLPGSESVIITPDHKLQSKAHRDYFQHALTLNPGDLGFSDINLNREHGVIETPHRPTIRSYTSVLTPDGTPFGMVIINYDLTHFLTEFSISKITDYQIYLTDPKGHILLSPHINQAFQYEWDDEAPHWQDQFKPFKWSSPETEFQLPFYEYSPDGEKLAVFESRLAHPLLSDQQQYTLLIAIPTTYLQKLIQQKVRYPLLTFSFFIVCIIVCALTLNLFLNRRYTRQVRTLNQKLENQVEHRTQELQQALQDKNLLFSAIQHQLIYSETTREGQITDVNDLFCQTSGYPRKAIIGKTHHFLSSGEHPKSFWRDLWNTIKSGKNWRGIICNRHYNGHFFWTDTLIFPILNSSGELSKYISFRLDVTEIINSRKRMEEAKQLAESANQAKTNFLTSISHEIRTPLNVIIGMNYLLNTTSLDKNQKELLQSVDIASKNLLALINDLLDFSKIEAGQLTLEYNPFSLSQLLDDLHLMFKNLLDPQKQQLLIEQDSGLPDTLISDSSRLKQMLINLLNNAIKFTPEGQITLTVKQTDSDCLEDDLCLRFTVEDTGIGIDPAVQSQLFHPFVQAESSTSRRFGGTGLGLSFVKKLTALMEGQIGFSSQPGQGSTFWLELPFKLAEESILTESQKVIRQPLQLLFGIAENSPLKSSLSKWSEQFGWQTTWFHNPAELLQQAVLKLQANQMIDGIILDALLIQKEPSFHFDSLKYPASGQVIPYLVMASDTERQTLLHHFSDINPLKIAHKPSDACELFNQLNQTLICNGRGFTFLFKKTRLISSDFVWLSGVKILAVDDSLMNLKFIQRLLVKEGAKPTLCESGQDALEILQTSPPFDACLMDLQMPLMDGCETTQKIRQSLHLTDLPIIAVTAGATTDERNKAFNAGMNDFLTKPLAPFEFIQILRQYIERHRNQPLLLQPRLTSDTTLLTDKSDWPDIKGIEIDSVKTRLSGDLEFFRRSLQRFCSESPLTDLPSSYPKTTEERQKLARQLHKLAGNSGLVGAIGIYERSKALETTLLSDEAVDFNSLYQNLRQHIQTVMDSARSFLAESVIDDTDASPIAETALDFEQLEILRQQLIQKRINSLSLFKSMAPALQTHLETETFKHLQQAMEQLDFQMALEIIAVLQPQSKN